MNATAKINPEYAVRTLLFGLMLVGFGGWSLYDGLVGYPRHNERVKAYQEYHAKYEDGTLTREQWFTTWKEYAASRGWQADKPKGAHSAWDIRTQFIMAAIFFPLGLWSLVGLARKLPRRFGADAAGLHGFGPGVIPYASLAALDKAKWDKKGIVKVVVVGTGGQEQALTLDDWHFRGMAAILGEIEKQRPDLVPPAPVAPAAEAAEPPAPPPVAP